MEKAPDLGLVTAISLKGSVSRDGFDGTTAWNASGNSVFESHGLEAARIARDAQFFVDTDVKKRLPRRFVAGKETVNGEEAYVVRAGGPGDVSERLSFSASTGLLIRREVLRRSKSETATAEANKIRNAVQTGRRMAENCGSTSCRGRDKRKTYALEAPGGADEAADEFAA